MHKKKYAAIHIFIVALIGMILFVPFLGKVHLFDWDEINFAEAAREMLVTKDFLNVKINYVPFWEKPPLFIWMQVFSMGLFGVSEFAARLPNAICGVVSLIAVFLIGRKLYSTQFGYLWVLSYIAAILPFIYFKSGIIDPWFNLFIFIGIYFFIAFIQGMSVFHKYKYLVFSAICIGLAVLTKGPVAMLIFFSVFILYAIIYRSWPISIVQSIVFVVFMCSVGFSWFFIQYSHGNSQLITDFINYQIRLFSTQDAGHGGPFYYHFIVLFIGLFPIATYALKGLRSYEVDEQHQRQFKRWMVLLLIVVLFIFSIVKTKIVHYSSLTYFPLTFLAAYAVFKVGNNSVRFNRLIPVGVILTGLLWVAFAFGAQYIPMYKTEIIQMLKISDVNAVAALQADVVWTNKEHFIGVFLVVVLVIYLLINMWHYVKAYVFLCVATVIYTIVVLYVFTPKIEQYSQNAAIEFYKQHASEDCYIETIGFKSYANLFYGERRPVSNPKAYDRSWLVHENTDKPVYFVCKLSEKNKILKDNPELEYLYEKNGFVFFKKRTQ